jgi:hypothetical protein
VLQLAQKRNLPHLHYPLITLVIKDSWQFIERDEEGELLQVATANGVVNVARYYHHETVQVRGADDDVRSNVRKGLEQMKVTLQDYLFPEFLVYVLEAGNDNLVPRRA